MKQHDKIQSNPNDPRFERAGVGAMQHNPAAHIKPRNEVALENRIAADIYVKTARILKQEFGFKPEELQRFSGFFFDKE